MNRCRLQYNMKYRMCIRHDAGFMAFLIRIAVIKMWWTKQWCWWLCFHGFCCHLRIFCSWQLCWTYAGVGKSCLLLRFSDDSFTTSFITTIGWGSLLAVNMWSSLVELQDNDWLPGDLKDQIALIWFYQIWVCYMTIFIIIYDFFLLIYLWTLFTDTTWSVYSTLYW